MDIVSFRQNDDDPDLDEEEDEEMAAMAAAASNTSLTPGFQRMFANTYTPASALKSMAKPGGGGVNGDGIATMALDDTPPRPRRPSSSFSFSFPSSPTQKEKLQAKLRALARDALFKRLHTRASFYADKLVTLSQGQISSDVVLLAQAYQQGRSYRRAVHVLERNGLLAIKDSSEPLTREQQRVLFTQAVAEGGVGVGEGCSSSRSSSSLEGYLLAAQCLAASDRCEECLLLLEQVLPAWEEEWREKGGREGAEELEEEEDGGEEGDLSFYRQTRHVQWLKSAIIVAGARQQEQLEGVGKGKTGGRGKASAPPLARSPSRPAFSLPSPQAQSVLTTLAAMCCLRAQLHEGQDNRTRAAAWCRHALQFDVYCVEALEFLVDRKLMSQAEEGRLLREELEFSERGEEEEEKEEKEGKRGREEGEVDNGWLRLVYTTRLLCFSDGQLSVEEQHRGIREAFAGLAQLGMGKNAAILTAQAEMAYYYQHDPHTAHALCKEIRVLDPFYERCLPVYLSSLVELRLKTDLYYLAHRLVEIQPKSAVAWFAVGCYYVAIHKNEAAQRYFHKATKLDHAFAPAWLGFGNAFAAQDESDQAMSAYRTASRLFPSLHFPLLYSGMEYLRTNNLSLALHFIQAAHGLNPMDALVHNEWGVVHFRRGKYAEAAERFRTVLALAGGAGSRKGLGRWEGTVVNLAHCCRKEGKFQEAIEWYELALGLAPKRASTYVALAFTHQLRGELDRAIEYYHRALGFKSGDAFAVAMLSRALGDAILVGERGGEGGGVGALPPPTASLIMSVPLPEGTGGREGGKVEKGGRRVSTGSEIYEGMDEGREVEGEQEEEEDTLDLSG